MFESTKIIGDNQYKFARQLMDQATEEITGNVIDYRHTFVDMSNLNVTLPDSTVVKTCSPAMGYAFAAGTTDGPGMFGFTQGSTSGNPFWDKVSAFLSEPTPEEIACQAPKPILLNTGDIHKFDRSYEWDPRTVPLQIFRVGNLFIVSVPSEFTTMAGRRLRAAVSSVIEKSGILPAGTPIHVTIAGLANTYSSYVTTFEEYQAQRYEAASTIFGPHTLEGYIQEYIRITSDLVSGRPSTTGAPPPDLTDVQMQFMPTAKFDKAPKGHNFGDVIEGQDVKPSYAVGENVKVMFYGANPRHNQRAQGTYLTVERKVGNTKEYKVVARDGDWETKFSWLGGKEDPIDVSFSPFSKSTVEWDIPTDAQTGTYRICYFGDHKIPSIGKPLPFTGCSSDFQVVAASTSSK